MTPRLLPLSSPWNLAARSSGFLDLLSHFPSRCMGDVLQSPQLFLRLECSEALGSKKRHRNLFFLLSALKVDAVPLYCPGSIISGFGAAMAYLVIALHCRTSRISLQRLTIPVLCLQKSLYSRCARKSSRKALNSHPILSSTSSISHFPRN